MITDLNQLKVELVQYFRWMREFGLNDSHSGNASVKHGYTIWITPSGACAETLRVDDLVMCNLDGSITGGASIDAQLHIECYQKRSDTGAVLHSHNPHTLALTSSGEELKPIDFDGQSNFERIPLVRVPFEDYARTSARKVSNALQNSKACVVQGRGVFAVGKTLNLAYKWTNSLEQSAKIAYLTQQRS